jgi:hypothetical protein
MVEKYHQRPSFSIENKFFQDYCFRTLMTDGVFNWFSSAWYVAAIWK